MSGMKGSARLHAVRMFAIGCLGAALSACGGGFVGDGTVADADALDALQGSASAHALALTAPSGVLTAPLTSGVLRVLDSQGREVAKDIAVSSLGTYRLPALGGTPPYRIEICGRAGTFYTCLY